MFSSRWLVNTLTVTLSAALAPVFAALPALYSPVYAQGEEVSEPPGPVADKWAVVIGISKFKDPALNLKYAAKDAGDFRDFLIQKCHFAPDHIITILNEQATRQQIMDVLGDSWLPRVALPDDLAVIFFSTHGSASDMDIKGANYVVVHDTNPEKLYTTGISIQDLAQTIKARSNARRVLILLDACHSGAASDASKGLARRGAVDASVLAQGTGHAVICSSSKSESSWESKAYPNGVFTHTLMDSFSKNGDGTTLKEAFASLKDDVLRQVAAERGVTQTPVLVNSKWTGPDLLLAAPPAKPRPLPDAVKVTLMAASPPNSAVRPIEQSPTNSYNTTSQPGDSLSNLIAKVSGAERGLGAVIPDISGDFLGSNGVRYSFWQKGRMCGWSVLGITGNCLITADGKTLNSVWSGYVSGKNKSSLEVDENNRVIRINADDGIILNRMAP